MRPGSRKPKVLIVDDDGDIRNFIRYCLESRAQVDMAGGGEAALEKFTAAMRSREPYDLVLLDILMPGLNGRQVLEKLRNLESAAGREYLEGVKVVMLTALDDTGNVLQSFKHGCDSYLVKPFDENDLLHELRELGLIPAETGKTRENGTETGTTPIDAGPESR